KLLPANVTVTVAPRAPEAGVMDARVGGGMGTATIVNVTGAVVPASVVTVTLRASNDALGAMLKVAFKELSRVTFTFVTVTPVPLTKTVVPLIWHPVPPTVLAPPRNPAPVNVTATEVPMIPVAGAIEVRV